MGISSTEQVIDSLESHAAEFFEQDFHRSHTVKQ
jgi:hypothetical protein